MLWIERISSRRDEFLLIKADDNVIKTYIWLSGAWESVEAMEVAEIVMSGVSCSRGILIVPQISTSMNKDLLC